MCIDLWNQTATVTSTFADFAIKPCMDLCLMEGIKLSNFLLSAHTSRKSFITSFGSTQICNQQHFTIGREFRA